MNGVLAAGFTGFILVENGWGGKCERRGVKRELSERQRASTGCGEHREALLVGQKNVGRRLAVRKAGLAFGERGGGDDAGAFFYCDDLTSGDTFELIGLAAGPADFDGVGLGVIAEAEGEN